MKKEGYSSHNAEGVEVYVRSVFIVYIIAPQSSQKSASSPHHTAGSRP